MALLQPIKVFYMLSIFFVGAFFYIIMIQVDFFNELNAV